MPAPKLLCTSLAWPALLLALSGSVQAGPVDYHCPAPHTLRASFTPRDAIVTLDGQPHTLRRVRDSREARFVSRADGLTLTLSGSQASWQRGDEPAVVCRKVIAALTPEALHGRTQPAASAPAR